MIGELVIPAVVLVSFVHSIKWTTRVSKLLGQTRLGGSKDADFDQGHETDFVRM